jgi:signal transduction histidine kinase
VDEATRARSRAEAAAALARSALTARDVRTGAGAMLAVLAPRVPCDGVSIHVVDGGASAPGAPPSMRCVAAIGALAHLVGVALPRPTSATLTDCAECEIAPGVRLPAADGATMAGTALLVPLVAHGRQIGDVCAFTRDAAPPTSVPETLVALAPTAALALDALLLNAERERAVLEERRLGEQLRQAERLTGLGELVAGLAHEINNPLTGIRALAELLLEEPVSAEVHESARLIRRETDRAARVVHDLMTFARDREPAVHRPVAVAPLLKRALRMRAPVHRERGIAVTLAVEPSLPPVHGDAGQLQQVMLNLLQNAEQAMQESSVRQLAVGARRMVPEGGDGRDGWAGAQAVVVSIADTGIGMDDATLTRIFDPFFTTRTAGGGAGLGMSVSYGIVQAHAGAILVRSTPGGGTTFDVVLPADGCDPTSLAEGDGAPPGFDRDGVPAPDPSPSSLHPTSA